MLHGLEHSGCSERTLFCPLKMLYESRLSAMMDSQGPEPFWESSTKDLGIGEDREGCGESRHLPQMEKCCVAEVVTFLIETALCTHRGPRT